MSDNAKPAAPAPAQHGPAVQSGSPVFTAVIEIKRAATGAVERYTLTGTPVASEEEH